MTIEKATKWAQEVREEKDKLEDEKVDKLIEQYLNSAMTPYALANGMKNIYRSGRASSQTTLIKIEQIVADLTSKMMFEDMPFDEYVVRLRNAFIQERIEGKGYYYTLYTKNDNFQDFDKECVKVDVHPTIPCMQFFDKYGILIAIYPFDAIKVVNRVKEK